MDPTVRQNAKRCIQVLLPTVPAPVVDYALNSSFFASIAGPGSLSANQGTTKAGPGQEWPKFKLRRMDSGNFGELSLTSPKQMRHLRDNQFGDHTQLSFSISDAVQKQ
mmetsp:Transcript_14080/g.30526  ORF Transcript_14080/g.30526 Transcript_14080/m.30526 type:complete len:108 (-) Transcript_14080:832-1155(-)|eukprot:CAMPEP_0202899458 /NCGR_PEP_ID=MMETSP1392-20130828/7681_1 /ASSEMBLY_ACC=CAM_ASM_000868 /TAXON_ID=225041 /ORGANISM="Chlamydomonas chlamydogama, Strain SAG 11-48b" /LENGTH=107 /DNA_ID=CAMNT_0049585641 /DNA_START=292 /DNA_END=615 /DNA_ORIENTATION=+